jgi:hypothetical protein
MRTARHAQGADAQATHTQATHTQATHAQATHAQATHAQATHAQATDTQGPDDPEFPPALRTAGRVLAVIAGVAAGGAMLVIGGLYALLSTCTDYDGTTRVCGSLVGPLELVAVFGGAAAGVGGAAGTGATGQARWITGGLAIVIVLAMLLTFLLDMQQPALN